MNRSSEELRERPIGELLRELSQQTATLVRQEMELARAELSARGKKAGAGAGLLTGAGVAGLLALAALSAALIFALNNVMPAWLSAILVAVMWGIVAAVLAVRGRDQVKEASPPAPQTVETIKEDVKWAKNPTQSAGK